MIKYELRKKKNSFNGEELYFAKALHLSKSTTNSIAEKIERNCGVKKCHVYAVLTEFAECLKDSMANGENVDLDFIGRFKVEIESRGVKDPKDFSTDNITGAHINFTPESVKGKQTLISGMDFIEMK